MNSFLSKVVLCLVVAAYGVAAGVPRTLRGCGGDACGAGSVVLIEQAPAVEKPHCPLCETPVDEGAEPERKPGGMPCCPPGCVCCMVLPRCDVPGQGAEFPVRERELALLALLGAPVCGPVPTVEPAMRRVALDSGPPPLVMRSLRSWRLVI